MNKYFYLLVLCLCCLSANAQIVTTTPSLVTEQGSIEVIFDASKGTAGLKGYTGDVYAHTGVITNQSTSPSDWKYTKADWTVNRPDCKMTSLGNDKWKLTLTPDIRTYYGISNTSEKLTQLAFVFRSSDGKKEGKDTGGKDIFVNVYPDGLNVAFVQPADEQSIVEINKAFSFQIQSSQPASLRCLINGDVVKESSGQTSLSFSHTFTSGGNYLVVAEAQNGTEIVRDTAKVFVRSVVIREALPAGVRPGVNRIDEHSLTLCLYAPYKSNVFLIGDFNDWQLDNAYQMKNDLNYWWLTLSDLNPEEEYAYQYVVNGNLRIADPYTNKVLDPWNDKYIPSSVYPDLKPYPAGKTDGIVSVFQTNPASYTWQVEDFQPVSHDKLVVYELLIRDFTGEHSFAAAMQKLDYLKAMGVNAVELMPVNEFEGNSSWGYNPSFYFAVDKYYGTSSDYKRFVDECHKRGMAVIMDMVLNHSFGQCPFVQLYWEGTAPAANSPWYNVTSPNPTYSWGYDFNHEKEQTKALVDSINSYWMSEYKIDGFRFDFTKGFTQKPGDGWAYDASRIAILERMRDEIRKRKPEAIVIFEHLTDPSEEGELADDDILLWGNMNNAYCQSSMAYADGSDISGSIYSKRGFHQPNLLAYMESHDEERMMYKNEAYGNAYESYSIKDLNTAFDRAKLSAVFYLPTPGPKMIWQFGELGYDYSINYCEDGTINDNCRTNPKPVRWDYYDQPERKAIYDMYTKLNYLKANYPVFSTADMTYYLNGLLKSFVWRASDMNAFALGNFDVRQASISVTLPHAGTWYEVFSGKEINVSAASYTESLSAGEYRLYTDVKVDFHTGTKRVGSDEAGFSVYPNPVSDCLMIGKGQAPIERVVIVDLYGRTVISSFGNESIDVSNLSKGVYFLRIESEKGSENHKFIKK